ncbi:DUF4335 domain-containing protein [Synechococcus sp. M16CYN]
MQKNIYSYEQTAALLLIEGYPDLSASHGNDAISILSAWRLQIIGAPELEGTCEHLEALMTVVMPYARHCLSGVRRRFGATDSFVSISPNGSGAGHQLELRSSRDEVEPLQINLDDADLADLVQCLDLLRLDERVKLAWTIPADHPLKRREIMDRIPLQHRLVAPVFGSLALGATVAIAMIQPLPLTHEEATLQLSTPAAETIQPTVKQ